MKKILLSICFILTTSLLFSQQQSDPLLFMQGLKQGENQFFEIGDYTVSIVNVDKKYNEKEINKVLKNTTLKPLKTNPRMKDSTPKIR